jgi:hypothetical protein
MNLEEKLYHSQIDSFIETYGMIVSEVYGTYGKQESFMEAFRIASGEGGQIEDLNLLKSWAIEFEKIHENHDWSEGDYYDSIDEFLNTKIADLFTNA